MWKPKGEKKKKLKPEMEKLDNASEGHESKIRNITHHYPIGKLY